MPSNNSGRLDVRLRVNHDQVQQEIGKYIETKQKVVRDMYKQAGDMYKKLLAEKIPSLGFGELNKVFRYSTTTSKHGIELTAGILRKSEFGNVHDFLRFWLYGTKLHWVSLKAHPELAEWGLKRGIISEEGGAYYVPNPRYTLDGRKYKTRALRVSVRSHYRDVLQIQNQVLKQLMYKLSQL
jgi:hypothetical protein